MRPKAVLHGAEHRFISLKGVFMRAAPHSSIRSIRLTFPGSFRTIFSASQPHKSPTTTPPITSVG